MSILAPLRKIDPAFSVSADRGAPERLLAWNRYQWMIENLNHRDRDRDITFGKDVCLSHTGRAPASYATCNKIARALVRNRSSDIAETTRHFALHRGEALEAILSPD